MVDRSDTQRQAPDWAALEPLLEKLRSQRALFAYFLSETREPHNDPAFDELIRIQTAINAIEAVVLRGDKDYRKEHEHFLLNGSLVRVSRRAPNLNKLQVAASPQRVRTGIFKDKMLEDPGADPDWIVLPGSST